MSADHVPDAGQMVPTCFDGWWRENRRQFPVAHFTTAFAAWSAATKVEREACAVMCEESAGKLTAEKRTHQVDRHVADVLRNHAYAFRTRGVV